MLGELTVQFRTDKPDLLAGINMDALFLERKRLSGTQNRGSSARQETAPRKKYLHRSSRASRVCLRPAELVKGAWNEVNPSRLSYSRGFPGAAAELCPVT